MLGKKMTADPERDGDKPIAAVEKANDNIHDAEENTGIAAGYTYLGQFIDHDITFDPMSSLQKQNDPDALKNFRTPALDLDCVYGRGPDDQPYMYEPGGRKIVAGKQLTRGGKIINPAQRDLPRLGAKNRAVIGDKRNDENVIVSQLQGVFLAFHNRMAVNNPGWDFPTIQREVRRHYQYIVLNDYLPTIVGKDTMDKVWPGWKTNGISYATKSAMNCSFYKPATDAAYMPIEFSAAAYRFGHSMVRPVYRLSTELDATNSTGDDPSLEGRFFIFAGVHERGLNGFQDFPEQWGMDWSLFFDINNSKSEVGKKRVQPAYKIDTSLVNPLGFLPEFSEESSFVSAANLPLTLDKSPPFDNLRPQEERRNSPSNLAERNLWRGNSMGLPSGQDVAKAMGETPLIDSEILIGKATSGDPKVPLSSIDATFKDKAPLWCYVLAEAQAQWKKRCSKEGKTGDDADKVPTTMGPVGGRIVAETLIGLIAADSSSYLNDTTGWTPTVASNISDFIKYALAL